MTNADKVEEDINRLFELPLAEFTAARNALATRLKKAGRSGDAERVKSLAKPPVSAWAVAPPRPEGPAKEPEDCEYPEETEESKWEEAEAVWIVTYRPEEDPANCRDCRDYRYES